MPNFQGTFETHKWSFISAFSICMTVPLMINVIMRVSFGLHFPKTNVLWEGQREKLLSYFR